MIEVDDDVGRRVVLTREARRIVSLVPSLTETLFALGCAPSVVGVTRYCSEPVAMPEHVRRVGGTKNPSLEGIVALRPDLVLVNAEENRREDFAALEHSGLTVFVCFPQRVRDVVGMLLRLGRLTGTTVVAEKIAGELRGALLAAERCAGAERRLVFCPIWKNPWMSFNRETFAHDMLRSAGGDNVCARRAERYCTVTLEEIAAAMPEVILLPDEPYVFSTKDLAALRPLEPTPAWQAQRVHFIDGKALSWYGPRTAAGLGYLRAILRLPQERRA